MADIEYNKRVVALEDCCDETKMTLGNLAENILELAEKITDLETTARVNNVNTNFGLTPSFSDIPEIPEFPSGETDDGSFYVGKMGIGGCMQFVTDKKICVKPNFVDLKIPVYIMEDAMEFVDVLDEVEPETQFPYVITLTWNHTKAEYTVPYPTGNLVTTWGNKAYNDATLITHKNLHCDQLTDFCIESEMLERCPPDPRPFSYPEELHTMNQFSVSVGVATAYYDSYSGEFNRTTIDTYKFVRDPYSMTESEDWEGLFPFPAGSTITMTPSSIFPYVEIVDIGALPLISGKFYDGLMGTDMDNPNARETITSGEFSNFPNSTNTGNIKVKIDRLDESILFYDIYITCPKSMLKPINSVKKYPYGSPYSTSAFTNVPYLYDYRPFQRISLGSYCNNCATETILTDTDIAPYPETTACGFTTYENNPLFRGSGYLSSFYYFRESSNLSYKSSMQGIILQKTLYLDEEGFFDGGGGQDPFSILNFSYPLVITETLDLIINLWAEDGYGQADTYLYLLDSSNQIIAENNDYENVFNHSVIKITLEAGSYTVVAATYDEYQYSTFFLQVYTKKFIDATPPVESTVINKSLDYGCTLYAYQGESGNWNYDYLMYDVALVLRINVQDLANPQIQVIDNVVQNKYTNQGWSDGDYPHVYNTNTGETDYAIPVQLVKSLFNGVF